MSCFCTKDKLLTVIMKKKTLKTVLVTYVSSLIKIVIRILLNFGINFFLPEQSMDLVQRLIATILCPHETILAPQPGRARNEPTFL